MKYFIVLLLLLLISVLQYLKIVEVDSNTILLIIIAFVAMLCVYNNNEYEHYSPSQTDLEAIQTLSSMYNSGTLNITNLNVTGTSTLKGDIAIGGNANVTGNISVGGNTSVTGTSALIGDVTMSGNANVTNDLNVGTNNFTVHGQPTANGNEILRATTTDKANAFLIKADASGTFGWYNNTLTKFVTDLYGGETGGGNLYINSLTTLCYDPSGNHQAKVVYECTNFGAPHSDGHIKPGFIRQDMSGNYQGGFWLNIDSQTPGW